MKLYSILEKEEKYGGVWLVLGLLIVSFGTFKLLPHYLNLPSVMVVFLGIIFFIAVIFSGFYVLFCNSKTSMGITVDNVLKRKKQDSEV